MILLKNKRGALSAAVAVLVLMSSLFSFSSVASAEETELSPLIYCEYFDSTGTQVDGNSLSAGTYSVSFMVSGFDQIGVFQLTATYDESTVSVDSVDELNSALTSFGTVTDGGDLVFGFVTYGSAVEVNSDGELLATFTMTFAADCDADDCFSVSTNPNETFVVTDPSDYMSEYALVDTDDSYSGTLSLMYCDLTPALTSAGCTVTGNIMIANDAAGTASVYGIVGLTVTVYDSEGSEVASAVTASDGSYTLEGVPAGTYTAVVSGNTTVDRTVTLVVEGDKAVDDLGVVICDYNKDVYVNSIDLSTFLKYYGSDYYVYADLNADGYVNSIDLSAFLKIYGNAIVYPDVTL